MVEIASDLVGRVAREGEIEYGDRGGTLGPLRGSLLPGALQVPRQGQNFSAYTTGNPANRSKDESHTDDTQRFPHIPPVSGFFRIHHFFLTNVLRSSSPTPLKKPSALPYREVSRPTPGTGDNARRGHARIRRGSRCDPGGILDPEDVRGGRPAEGGEGSRQRVRFQPGKPVRLPSR